MKTLLWLDDIRDPKENIWHNWLATHNVNPFHYNITWVKTYGDFTKWVRKNGLPDVICFDHDLADNWELRSESDVTKWFDMTENSEYTGYDAAKWLVEYCMDNDLDLPKWNIQSANPVGADNIRGLLNNYTKYRNEG